MVAGTLKMKKVTISQTGDLLDPRDGQRLGRLVQDDT